MDSKKPKLLFSLILVAVIFVPSISYAVPMSNVSGRLSGINYPQSITITVVDQQGHRLSNVSVQGLLTLPPTLGAGVKTVFAGTTNSVGILVVKHLNKLLNFSRSWVLYQGKTLAKLSSPSILLFLTYTKDNSTYFAQSSISTTSMHLLRGYSYNSRAVLNVGKSSLMPSSNSKPNKTGNTANSAGIGGPLPLAFQCCPGNLNFHCWYIVCSKASPVQSIPLGMMQSSPDLNGNFGGTVDVMYFQDSESYLKAGFTIGLGSKIGSAVYDQGATIWQTSSSSSFLENTQTVPDSSHTSSYVVACGQMEGAQYQEWKCGNDTMVPTNTYMYMGAIYNLQPPPSSGTVFFGTPSSTYMNYVEQNYSLQQVANVGSSKYYTSATTYQTTVDNMFATSDTTWLNAGVDIGALLLAFVPGIDVITAAVLASVVCSITYGSTSTSMYMAQSEIWAEPNYAVDEYARVSVANWYTGSEYVQVPLVQYYISGFSTSTSSGGGGCVLNGTLVTLSNGSTIPVQDLQPGMKTLSYDTSNGSLLNTTVSRIIETNVSSVLLINHHISISGLGDQPVFVKLANGSMEWLVLGLLNYSMQIYNPVNDTWLPIKSIILERGNYSVYDVQTARQFMGNINRTVINDYIANGILLDKKIG